MHKEQNWFFALLGYAKEEEGKFILSVVLSMTSVLSGLIPYYCVYKIIEAMAGGFLTGTVVTSWCLVALVCYLIKALFYGLSTGLSHHVAFHVLAGLRLKVADRFLHAPLGEVQKYSIGEIKNLLVDKSEQIEPPLAHVVPEGAGHLILPLVSFLAILFVDWRMALAALITVPAAVICMMLTFKISGESFEKYNKSNAYMNSTIVEYTEGIEVIKAFGRAGVSYEKYANAITDYRTFVVEWMRSTWVTMKLAFALFPSTLLGTVPMGLYLAYNGSITIAEATLGIMLSMSMVSSLARLEVFSESIRQMKDTVEELERYLAIQELPEPEGRAEIAGYTVEAKNVHFSYEAASDGSADSSGKTAESGEPTDKKAGKEVLHGVSFTLPEGSFTALVGPSGSGKSTVAKLLARFWDVTEGSITIGGVDVKDIPLEQLTELVSFVTQDNFLFRTSILENIRIGNPKATDEEVKAAARAAQCEAFIEKLPEGYDTPAGEAGKRLSGGEKQRIAIARMMLKDAPIVILDEASAFTDPENEDKIQSSIQKLTKGKTLLVIAHRLSTIRTADEILVLDDGKITARGSQDALLKSCPLYEKMWKAHIGAQNWAVSTEGRNETEGVAEYVSNH